MAKSVDNKVVSLTFDNAQFEAGAKTSMLTLDRLKEAFTLKGLKNGLEDIKTNLLTPRDVKPMEDALNTIASRFDAFSVAATAAIFNITNRVVNLGIDMAKSLTIKPIVGGYQDYNTKLTSIQTITNATGKSVEEVNVYFQKLDEYADKTIYNLTDMTSSFAKFTNAGVDMDRSVPAIIGIANVVASAGQSAGAAQIAMYNLSQSIAGGFLTTTDYKSLNLANVATKEFKNELIEAAIAAGTIQRTGKDTYKILSDGSGKAATGAALFTSELSSQWATTEVLLNTLNKYGDASTDVGKKAYAAAQDVKSFPMMMETLAAQVGTSWTDTFEIMLGDLNEAKVLFTDLTNAVGKPLDAFADARNNLLRGWKELGGRAKLIEGLGNVFKALVSIIKPIGKAFRNIFPPTTSKQLYDLTVSFANFTEKLMISGQTAKNIETIFTALFAIVDVFVEIVKIAVGVLFSLFGAAQTGASGLTDLLATMTEGIVIFREWLSEGDRVTNFLDGIRAALKPVITLFKEFFGAISDTQGQITIADTLGLTGLAAIIIIVKKGLSGIMKLGEGTIGKITGIIGQLTNTLKLMQQNLKASILQKIAIAIGVLAAALFIMSIIDAGKLAASLGAMGILFGQITALFMVFSKIGVAGSTSIFVASTALTAIAASMLTFAIAIAILSAISWENLAKSISAFAAILIALLIFMKLLNKNKGALTQTAAILMLGIAMNFLATSLAILAAIPTDKLIKAVIGMTVVLGVLATFMAILGKFTGTFLKGAIALAAMGVAMIVVSAGITSLAIALALISTLEPEQVAKSLAYVAGSLIVLGIALKFMQNSIGGAAALTLAAAGLFILGTALALISSLGVGKIILAIITISVVLGILAAVSMVAAPGLLALAGSLAALGGAAILVGLAAILLGVGIYAIAMGVKVAVIAVIDVLQALVDFVLVSAVNIAQNSGPFFAALGVLILGFLDTIRKTAPAFIETVWSIIMAFFEELNNNIGTLIDIGANIIVQILNGIAKNLPDIIESAANVIVSFLDGLSEEIPKIADSAVTLITTFIDSIGKEMPRLLEAGADFMIDFINGLADTIEENDKELINAFENLGIALAKGLWEGIKSFNIISRVTGWIRNIIKSSEKELKTNSPSKVFIKIGGYVAEGLAVGIDDNAKLAYSSAKSLSESVIDRFNNINKEASNAMSLNIDANPVVKPVLDLSQYRKDAENMVRMIDTSSISATASLNAAANISKATEQTAQEIASNQEVKQETIVNFTQNNNSPKSLSNIDIYRQTKSLLAFNKQELQLS